MMRIISDIISSTSCTGTEGLEEERAECRRLTCVHLLTHAVDPSVSDNSEVITESRETWPVLKPDAMENKKVLL